MSKGYSAIGLISPKFSSNVGSSMRAAYNYGVSLIIIEGGRYKHNRADTVKAYRHIPTLLTYNIMTELPHDCIPIAVELSDNASPIQDFQHPDRALYIFGPEDSSIPEHITTECKTTIYIPTRRCMNLASTVNVVLYDRAVKRGEWPDA